MTSRERFLLTLLGMTALAVLVLWGTQAYLDEVNRLDLRFASLQKEAAQVQLRLVEGSAPAPESQVLADRFWPIGFLPEPLALARSIKPILDRWSVSIQEFQVVSAAPEEFRLKYTLDAAMASFLEAFVALKASDPKLIVRKFAATLRERGRYLIEWEVGYAVLP